MKESRSRWWRRKKILEIVCDVMLCIDVCAWIFQCEFSLSLSNGDVLIYFSLENVDVWRQQKQHAFLRVSDMRTSAVTFYTRYFLL
jgi:hypothetical protein